MHRGFNVKGVTTAALIWATSAIGLALGDGLASLFGKLFGHVIIPFTSGKTVAGSLTCFIAIFLSTYCCSRNLVCALWVAVAGMIIEIFPIKNFDNLTIPILVATISCFFVL